jgi:hypothetical protein
LEAIRGEYERYIAFHNQSYGDLEKHLADRTAWAQSLDRELIKLRSKLWVRIGRKLGMLSSRPSE